MYSLIVSNAASEQDRGTFLFDRGRFLEYTDEVIRIQLSSLSNEAIECLYSWPCIFMQEGRTDEEAYIVQITRVAATSREITVTAASLPDKLALTNDALWKLRRELDIADFEFSRYHWAVKERSVWPVLMNAGLHLDENAVARFSERPLPSPQRSALIRARDVIANWGHTALDDFLLEVGVSALSADRELGSQRDRANAILRFILENPGMKTAENSLLSAHFVRRSLGVQGDGRETHTGSAPPLTEAPVRAAIVLRESASRSPNRVFVVHGRNERARNDVIAFLTSHGLEGIVLHDQPNMGRHLLTKFIEEAELVTFAIVLMNDDDVGGAKDGPQRARARQNVILELGYFLAHLGQPSVCALITPGLETPSDFDGIVYIRMAEDGAWKAELARELRAAGMPVLSGSIAPGNRVT